LTTPKKYATIKQAEIKKKSEKRNYNMFTSQNSFGLFGINAFAVQTEMEITSGMPEFNIVGLGDAAVKESRDRIKAAVRSSGLRFPTVKITVNLAPADVKKSGSICDLSIAAALFLLNGDISGDLSDSAFIGECSLGGDIKPVAGVLPMALLARKNGIKNLFVPYENAFEASVAEGINVYGVKSLKALIGHFHGQPIKPQEKYIIPPEKHSDILDFADVKGHVVVKKALEIAAAGGHNLLMIGPPGSGKSMIAKRIPTIMPPLTFDESVDITNIYSAAGLIDRKSPLVTTRPFRSPHHNTSTAGLIGGGNVPVPGDISLSHFGVLFLDELPEFQRNTLEALRQPIEDGIVTISRAAGKASYPCSFMLVAAMNPCPCGCFGSKVKKCTCKPEAVKKYLGRISGPLLDRFDIQIEVGEIDYDKISSTKKEESSADIRKRVGAARALQQKRFAGTKISCNAKITENILRDICKLSPEADKTLRDAYEKMGLSARAHERILKVARTIADLDGADLIGKNHIARAVQFRSLDRKYKS
jgi:magnesium chelatase family protein